MVEYRPEEDPFATPTARKVGIAQRRRAKMRAEIDRNRRGEHRVPTWVFVLALVVIIAVWAVIIVTG